MESQQPNSELSLSCHSSLNHSGPLHGTKWCWMVNPLPRWHLMIQIINIELFHALIIQWPSNVQWSSNGHPGTSFGWLPSCKLNHASSSWTPDFQLPYNMGFFPKVFRNIAWIYGWSHRCTSSFSCKVQSSSFASNHRWKNKWPALEDEEAMYMHNLSIHMYLHIYNIYIIYI
jgi:hypothetical protein